MLLDREQMESLLGDLVQCLEMEDCQSVLLIMDPAIKAFMARKYEEASIEGIREESMPLSDIPAPASLAADVLFTIGLPMTPAEFLSAMSEQDMFEERVESPTPNAFRTPFNWHPPGEDYSG